jgi:hypothetical protein
MSVFTPTKNITESKVRNSQYIKTENKPDEAETKPAEPANPEQPEAK